MTVLAKLRRRFRSHTFRRFPGAGCTFLEDQVRVMVARVARHGIRRQHDKGNGFPLADTAASPCFSFISPPSPFFPLVYDYLAFLKNPSASMSTLAPCLRTMALSLSLSLSLFHAHTHRKIHFLTLWRFEYRCGQSRDKMGDRPGS